MCGIPCTHWTLQGFYRTLSLWFHVSMPGAQFSHIGNQQHLRFGEEFGCYAVRLRRADIPGIRS